MKINIGTYGLHPNGLTDDEVIELFNREFETTAVIHYLDFVQQSLKNIGNSHPFDTANLIRRDEVAEFIEARLERNLQEVH